MANNQESLEVWSSLVNYPIFYYDSHTDNHLCAWNGAILPRSAAIYFISVKFMQLFMSKSVRQNVVDDFQKLELCGIKFKCKVSENSLMRDVSYIISGGDENNLVRFTDELFNTTPEEAILWMSSKNQKIV